MPKFETLAAIAAALGVSVTAILAEPKGKGAEDWRGELVAAFDALEDRNKSAVLTVAQTLLKRQKR